MSSALEMDIDAASGYSTAPLANDTEAPTPLITENITLDPTGNIVLLVGSPPVYRVKVTFERLAEVSPVFRSMLSGKFAEGQTNRSSEHPQQLDLPEDDPQAISDLCHLLYHTVDHLSGARLEADQLFHLFQAADKYDCIDGLGLQLRALMQKHFDETNTLAWKDSVLRTAATFLLRDAKYFELATQHLITNFNESFSGMRKLEGGDLLPTIALLAMAERRAQAQLKIGWSLGTPASCSDCESSYDMRDYDETWYEMFAVDAWPPAFEPGRGPTLADILSRMRQIRAVDYGENCPHDRGGGRIDFLEVADKVDGVCKGLCILCVRDDSVDLGDDRCTHET